MFGLVAAEIVLSWLILDTDNPLRFMTQQPKISHIRLSQPLSLYTIIYNAHCSGAVTIYGDRQLTISQFLQGESHDFFFGGVEEEGAEFCFGCGRGDHF